MRLQLKNHRLRFTVHRTPYTISWVIFFLSIASTAMAAPNYERTVDQLSQAVTTYKALTQHQEKYSVAFRRDPMRPLVDAQGKLLTSVGLKEGLSVQGIIWSEAHPLVVIDGELFGKGDTIDQYTIEEIHPDEILARNGETLQHIPLERGIDTTSSPPAP